MAEEKITPTMDTATNGTHLIMSTRFSESVYQWLNNAQYYLLPGTCILCCKPSYQHRDLCHDCSLKLTRINNPCTSCGLPLPPGCYAGKLCGTCLLLPPPYQRLIAPFQYSPPVSALVAAYKYNRKLVNGRVLAGLLAGQLRRSYQGMALPTLLVATPLHPRRMRSRGFNQALEIAKRLGTEMDIPLSPEIVVRVKNTPQQTGLNARARKRNIRCAFSMKSNFCFKANTTIAIVDDVVTTGATVAELAKVLLNAGAREVHVWGLARTVS